MNAKLAAARERAEYLLEDPHVVGVGVGLEGRVVVSILDWKGYCLSDIPMTIEGVSVRVIETGPFVALQDRTARERPCPGGMSIGHKDVTAGTLGCLVRKGDAWFILSNNHVLANMNDAEIGDEILQPGKYDGGTVPDDVIATLEDFVPVEPMFDVGDCPVAGKVASVYNALVGVGGSKHRMVSVRKTQATNLVDAAIARPTNPNDVIRDVLGVPIPQGYGEAKLGMSIVKSGRTTGVTRGKVTQVNATLQVQYGNGIAVFEDQVVCDAGCSGGDSGSTVQLDDGSGTVVGLLFAGTQDGNTMIMNQIGHVLDALEVAI